MELKLPCGAVGFVCVCASALHIVLPPQRSDSKTSAGLMTLQGYLSVPVRHAASVGGWVDSKTPLA